MAGVTALRSSTTRLAKIFSLILALLVFVLVSISTISGFLLYQTIHPARSPAAIDLNVMMGHPTTFSFPLANGTMREGWFFPGLRGAPTVVVCHGYLSQRADLLTLVASLQDHQYNVFVFDFAGHGSSSGITTLGYEGTGELRAAIQALSERDDIDPRHFGLWGADMGGYVALEVASTDRRIAAVAVDDAYNDPRDMLRYEIRSTGLAALPLVLPFSEFGFRMVSYRYRDTPPVSKLLARTAGIHKLFVESGDRPELADETVRLFQQAPAPKNLMAEPVSYMDMSDDQRKAYENQIVSFFLQTIPPSNQ